MINELSSVTGDLVRAVLDVSMERQKVIANNIANHNTLDFAPQKLEFESILASEFAESNSIMDDKRVTEVLEFVQPNIQDRDEETLVGNPERALDIEMADMAQNTLRYEALIRGLSKLSDIRSMAISGGRR